MFTTRRYDSFLRFRKPCFVSHKLSSLVQLAGVLSVGTRAVAEEPPAPAAVHAAADLPEAPQPNLPLASPEKSPAMFAVSAQDPIAPADLVAQEAPAPQASQQNQEPSLGDLGLSKTEVQADPQLQAKLDRRSHMLKLHQRFGLLTLIPMAAAVISSGGASADKKGGGDNATGRNVHMVLGASTVVMYGLTASYAIRAPRIPEEKTRGPIKLHKYLIFVHAPAMVLTPILGAMAYQQESNGQKVHGIASAHGAVAWTAVFSYTAAMLAASLPIHLKH